MKVNYKKHTHLETLSVRNKKGKGRELNFNFEKFFLLSHSTSR